MGCVALPKNEWQGLAGEQQWLVVSTSGSKIRGHTLPSYKAGERFPSVPFPRPT
jgi:hypothetical protein